MTPEFEEQAASSVWNGTAGTKPILFDFSVELAETVTSPTFFDESLPLECDVVLRRTRDGYLSVSIRRSLGCSCFLSFVISLYDQEEGLLASWGDVWISSNSSDTVAHDRLLWLQDCPESRIRGVLSFSSHPLTRPESGLQASGPLIQLKYKHAKRLVFRKSLVFTNTVESSGSSQWDLDGLAPKSVRDPEVLLNQVMYWLMEPVLEDNGAFSSQAMAETFILLERMGLRITAYAVLHFLQERLRKLDLKCLFELDAEMSTNNDSAWDRCMGEALKLIHSA